MKDVIRRGEVKLENVRQRSAEETQKLKAVIQKLQERTPERSSGGDAAGVERMQSMVDKVTQT